MKNLYKSLILALLMTSITLHGETNVPRVGTPSALLEKSQEGPRELLNSMLTLKDNIRELRDQKTFDQFFELLNDFDLLAQKFNLDSIYPNAVNELGRNMVMHGNRWLRVSVDDIDKILAYQEWADITVALRFKNQIDEEVRRLYTPEEFDKAFKNLTYLKEWAKNNFPNDLYLIPSYTRTVSDIAFNAIINTEIENIEQWEKWISGINNQVTVQNYLSFLNRQILSSDIDESNIYGWQLLMIKLGAQLETIETLSTSVVDSYGILVADFISYATYNELPLEPSLFDELLDNLYVSSLRGILFRWVNPKEVMTNEYATKLLELSEILRKHLNEVRMFQEIKDLDKFIAQYLIPAYATENGIEGTYKLRNQSGDFTLIFTIIRERENRLIAALSNKNASVNFAFFNIFYDAETRSFIATENETSDEYRSNYTVRFKVQSDGTLELSLPYRTSFGGTFRGEKKESYQNIMANHNASAERIEGTYKGEIHLPSGPMEFTLNIVSFNNTSDARLESKSGAVQIHLSKGSNNNSGFIYLTSGRNQRGTWFHLRLQKDGNDLVGVAIVGGTGVQGKAFFSKVN